MNLIAALFAIVFLGVGSQPAAAAAPAACTPEQYGMMDNPGQGHCGTNAYACVPDNKTTTPSCSTDYTVLQAGCAPDTGPDICQVTTDAPWNNGGGGGGGGGGPAKQPVGSGDRTITLVNSCSHSVWWGYTGGAYGSTRPTKSTPAVKCTSDSDCPGKAGQKVCDTTAAPGGRYCFWALGTNSGIVVPQEIAEGGDTTVSVNNTPQDAGGAVIKWSGNIWGAKGCKTVGDRLVCDSLNCGTLGCTTFRAPSGVRTQAEFTLQSSAQDYYDISAIAGFTIPMSMEPTSGQSLATYSGAATKPGNSGQPSVDGASYWCKNAGDTSDQGVLSACTWSADISSVTAPTPGTATNVQITLINPAHVTTTGWSGTPCTTDADCAGNADGGTCGMWQSVDLTGFGPMNPVNQYCGEPIGMITPDGYCAYVGTNTPTASTVPVPWQCAKTPANGIDTYSNLYQCAGGYNKSGYQIDNVGDTTVCGCENWKFGTDPLPVGQLPCQANDTVWQDNARWGAEAVKRACPTAYSYPFDDETSTFTCQTPAGKPGPGKMKANATSYTITFCPDHTEGGVSSD